HVGNPIPRDANTQQRAVGEIFEESPRTVGSDRSGDRHRGLDVSRDHDLFHGLANLDDLRRAGRRMHLHSPAFCPCIGLVVMIDVTQQEAAAGLVYDQANVRSDPDGPEVSVPRAIQLVKLVPGICGVGLQVKGSDLDLLLLLTRQTLEAREEGIRDPKIHRAGIYLPRQGPGNSGAPAALANLAEISLCAAFRSFESSGHGQARITACSSGGSSAATSKAAPRTAAARKSAAP